MISRRGLFRLLTGAVASPVLKPLAALIPVSGKLEGQRFSVWVSGIWRQRSAIRDPLVTYYDQNMLDNLRANTPMTKMCQTFDLPPRSGNQITFFTYVTKLKEEGAFEEPWETT